MKLALMALLPVIALSVALDDAKFQKQCEFFLITQDECTEIKTQLETVDSYKLNEECTNDRNDQSCYQLSLFHFFTGNPEIASKLSIRACALKNDSDLCSYQNELSNALKLFYD